MRRRTLQALFFSAITMAVFTGLVGTTSPMVKSVSTVSLGSESLGAVQERDEYSLTGYRWTNRTIVNVYSNWDGGACTIDGTNFGGDASISVDPISAAATLQASLADINAQLGGGLVLAYGGPVAHSELCVKSTARPIVIGWGTLPETGRALSYGLGQSGSGRYSFQYARVFITNKYNFVCNGSFRDLQHTVTHELLHAIGVGHSLDATAIMSPSSTACQASPLIQADDVRAMAALYPPTVAVPTVVVPPIVVPPLVSTPAPTAAATSTPAPTTSSTVRAFAATPMFSTSGQALVVFDGGTVDQLEASARAVGATGVWAQDAQGRFQLLVVGGPAFTRSAFNASFPSGFAGTVAVTLIR